MGITPLTFDYKRGSNYDSTCDYTYTFITNTLGYTYVFITNRLRKVYGNGLKRNTRKRK